MDLQKIIELETWYQVELNKLHEEYNRRAYEMKNVPKEALEKARKDQEFIEAFDKFYLESKPTDYRRYWNEMLQAWKARSE